MHMTNSSRGLVKRRLKTIGVAALGYGAVLAAGLSLHPSEAVAESPSGETIAGRNSLSPRAMVFPLADGAHGRQLFVSKGCVICHSVNGVGGRAAPALDAFAAEEGEAPSPVDPLDFVARMWRGAPAMLELQAVELGYQIELSAEELADLAVFASDAGAQASFTMEDVPEPMWDWMLNEPYWVDDSWPEKLFEGYPNVEDDEKPD